MEFVHEPVMLAECIEALKINPSGVYIDGTVGGGGHSSEIVKRIGENGKLIAFDKDEVALKAAAKRLAPYTDKVTFIHDDFKSFEKALEDLGIGEVDGVLLDLGISSPQIDHPERGFSYTKDARLDMRMNSQQSLSAYQVINEYSQERLTKIFREYGEERLDSKIAARIISEREKEPITTTMQLADLVARCYPKNVRYKFGNPAKRVFQAVRIEVNRELDGLSEAVTALVRRLKKGGRMAVITFHSLEDRIVKTAFKQLNLSCVCPPSFPVCVCNKVKEVELIGKVVMASQEELARNSRAESAKLRIIERI